MTLAAADPRTERRSTERHLVKVPSAAMMAPDGLEALHTLLRRTLAAIVDTDGEFMTDVLTESINAFIAFDGASQPAAAHVAGLLRKVGEQYAQRGLDAGELAESFRRTQIATQRGLQFAVPKSSKRGMIGHVRANVNEFIQQLCGEALSGWEQTHAILTMSERERRDKLGASLLQGTLEGLPLSRLADLAHIDLTADYIMLVSTAAALPPIILDHEQTLVGANLCEAFIPATWSGADLDDVLIDQAVIGPPLPLREVATTAGPTRQGAELLHAGRTSDPHTVVQCTDLLASLVVEGNPMLTELIVAKHLNKMETMSPNRRFVTGDLLLQWLERGLPIRQLARELDIPSQTAHSRMKSIRALFGDAIDDPAQRLELIIALQATLPRWRAEASGAVDS